MLGDDLIDPRDPLLSTMIAAQRELGGSVVALIEVDPSDIHLYGCAAIKPAEWHGAAGVDHEIVRVTDLVEKPEADQAPSNYAVIGRYVLDPAVFEVLHETEPGRGGEIQLTDALRVLAQRTPGRGGPVHGVVFKGRRYDTGDKGDYLRAIVRLACERDDLGPQFRAWLREFLDEELAGR
jgi:UTP--glucose-1-phosphate uridylyltransferase